MNFLKKLFSKRTTEEDPSNHRIPISLFSKSEYQQFVQLVSDYFQERGDPFKIENGFVLLPDRNGKLSLTNVAQKCHQSKPDAWKGIIQDHFANVHKIMADTSIVDEAKKDFSAISSRLAIRIWPLGTLAASGQENLIYREDLPDTISALVLDLPDRVLSVTPNMVARWGRKIEDLFDQGLANVREQCQPEQYGKELDGEINVQVITSSNYFTATYSLLISEVPELQGSYGALVAIPHRHVMVCYPIEGIQVIQAIHQLAPIIDQLFREGPGSISPHLYWYHEGKYSAISYNARKKEIDFPPDFKEVLDNLAGQSRIPHTR